MARLSIFVTAVADVIMDLSNDYVVAFLERYSQIGSTITLVITACRL